MDWLTLALGNPTPGNPERMPGFLLNGPWFKWENAWKTAVVSSNAVEGMCSSYITYGFKQKFSYR